jgi:tetratricopeptide (TPR) repeat protein
MTGGLMFLSVVAVAGEPNPDLERAEGQYERTDYQAAINTLLMLSPKSARVYELLGRAYYMDGQYKNSIRFLEKAITETPLDSNFFDWLGKAYGRRAEGATFLTALSYANKARIAFEEAVSLDPKSLDAMEDLFEYYRRAPGKVGGGLDKAEKIAGRIRGFSEAEYARCEALIAEKQKKFQVAEQELRRAIQLAPEDVDHVVDLAEFLSDHGRYAESDDMFQLAERTFPNSAKLLFARAAAYVKSGRNPEEARQLLRQYTELQLTPDDPPRSEAVQLLKKL